MQVSMRIGNLYGTSTATKIITNSRDKCEANVTITGLKKTD